MGFHCSGEERYEISGRFAIIVRWIGWYSRDEISQQRSHSCFDLTSVSLMIEMSTTTTQNSSHYFKIVSENQVLKRQRCGDHFPYCLSLQLPRCRAFRIASIKNLVVKLSFRKDDGSVVLKEETAAIPRRHLKISFCFQEENHSLCSKEFQSVKVNSEEIVVSSFQAVSNALLAVDTYFENTYRPINIGKFS